MSAADPNGLNAGYVGELLETYLESPSSVPPEWREIFETNGEAALTALPGLQRLLARRAPEVAQPAVAPPPEPEPAATPQPAAAAGRRRPRCQRLRPRRRRPWCPRLPP